MLNNEREMRRNSFFQEFSKLLRRGRQGRYHTQGARVVRGYRIDESAAEQNSGWAPSGVLGRLLLGWDIEQVLKRLRDHWCSMFCVGIVLIPLRYIGRVEFLGWNVNWCSTVWLAKLFFKGGAITTTQGPPFLHILSTICYYIFFN